jgi:pimeloyl-ACP methyl ester carboxylesterase
MKEPMKDMIILLPGILGSALAKDGRPVWDVSVGAIGNALFSLGVSLQDLTLGSEASSNDGVTPTHLVADVHMIPYLWKIDGYSGLSEFIRSKFDVVPDENFFEFPYDWRLDNRISAQRLSSFVGERLDSWRGRHPDAQLILIAHSMGGLVARYFLEVLGGWRDTRRLITLGTPHRGSVKALDVLVNGLTKRIGSFNLVNLNNLNNFVRSCPSVYQLLPIYPCVGATEENLKRIEDLTELGKMDIDRAHAGIEFHREIERAVAANFTDSIYQAARYTLQPIVGTYQPTFLSALLTSDGIQPLETYKGKSMLEGDGTVPRFSATPIELSNKPGETFVASPHAGLQNSIFVRNQIESVLSDVDISAFKGSGAEAISLRIADVFSSNEPFQALAHCEMAIDPMQATLIDIETGRKVECEFEIASDTEGWQRLELSPLAAGTYRIEVNAGDEAEPITDVFGVLD